METLTVGNVAQIDDITIFYAISMTCWRREWDSNPRYGSRDFGPSGDHLLRNDWLSSSIGALLYRLGWPEVPQGIAPCRVVCSAGLRWCGGWRRTNLRGFHDETQIEA